MPDQPQLNIGVANPFTLAEQVLGRPVLWDRVDMKATLSRALGMPYERLFDPKYGSPIYGGLQLKGKALERVKVPTTAPLPARIVAGAGGPYQWIDAGHFFEEFAEMSDPVQGNLGDCWFIAALAAVAWTRPDLIVQRTRDADSIGKTFVDQIPIYTAAGAAPKVIEITEKLPMQSSGGGAPMFVYARSHDPGELWPGMYEKAIASQVTGCTNDQPDYSALNGGDPVFAMTRLTGMNPTYYFTSGMAEADIFQRIRENCRTVTYTLPTLPGRPQRPFPSPRKTVRPMTAWTYGSGDSAPVPVDYATARLVANHAYTVLGLYSPPPLLVLPPRQGQWVVLRNPWGCYEPGAGQSALQQNWTTPEDPLPWAPFQRVIDLSPDDGIFAISIDEFKKYFAGFGVVA